MDFVEKMDRNGHDVLRRWRLTALQAWQDACAFDRIPPDTQFAIFAPDNPYVPFYEQARRQIVDCMAGIQSVGYVGLEIRNGKADFPQAAKRRRKGEADEPRRPMRRSDPATKRYLKELRRRKAMEAKRIVPDDETIIVAVLGVTTKLKIGVCHAALYPRELHPYGVAPEDVLQRHIDEATRRHIAEIRRQAKAAKPKPAPAKPEGRFMGVRHSAVLAWMGANGWTFDEAEIAFDWMRYPIGSEKISAGMEAGRNVNGEFDLPDHVIEQLNDIRG